MSSKKLWTKDEDTLLIQLYPVLGTAIVSKFHGTRSINAIKNRAQQLGVIHRQPMCGWSDEEIKILKTYYPVEGKKVLDRLPGRTLKTIQVTACRLGIKRQFIKAEK